MEDQDVSAGDGRVGERRPGGRAARVRAAVLDAAIELLDEVGYDTISTEEVAKRAGVHRTTVYRRWPTKPELVAEAIGLGVEEAIPIADTGDLAADLLALARSVAANLADTAAANRSRSMVAAAATSEPLTQSLHRLMDGRVTQSEPIVTRAVARGDLPSDADPRVVIEPIVGAIWFRFLLTGEAIDDDFVRSVVEVVGIGAGEATGTAPGGPAADRTGSR